MRSADHDWLYDLLVGERGSRWRYRGRTPSPSEFIADLWRGVHTQFVIVNTEGHPVGIVGIYNHNPSVAAAHLFVVSAARCGHLGTEAAGLLMNWAFIELELDKIWVETPEFNLTQFSGLIDVAEVEGRLRDYDHWRGRFWDLYILSINRDTWQSQYQELLARRVAPVAHSGQDHLRFDAELRRILDSTWPLDSLAAVEVLTLLEEHSGQCIDPVLLADLEQLEVDMAHREILARLERLGVGAQQSG